MEDFIKDDELSEKTVNQILKTTPPDLANLNDTQCEENSINDITNSDEQNIIENKEIINQLDDEKTEKIEIEDANKTNCLALTIREEHKLVAVKNVFLHSLKSTWKVIVSTIALHILKLFL